MNDIVGKAWRSALRTLRGIYGSNIRKWVWGRHHRVEFRHPLGKLPWIGKFFTIGPFPAPGGMETLNQISFRLVSGRLNAVYGPATRRIIDFSQAKQSWSILPTGQSGRVLDQHYDDQVRAYLAVNTEG